MTLKCANILVEFALHFDKNFFVHSKLNDMIFFNGSKEFGKRFKTLKMSNTIRNIIGEISKL